MRQLSEIELPAEELGAVTGGSPSICNGTDERLTVVTGDNFYNLRPGWCRTLSTSASGTSVPFNVHVTGKDGYLFQSPQTIQKGTDIWDQYFIRRPDLSDRSKVVITR